MHNKLDIDCFFVCFFAKNETLSVFPVQSDFTDSIISFLRFTDCGIMRLWLILMVMCTQAPAKEFKHS